MDDLDELLTSREYAYVRRCSLRTVERERTAGTGCRYIKIGRGVRYKQADVLDFIERHARQSTSEREPQAAPLTDRDERPIAVEQVERALTDLTGAEAENGGTREVRYRGTNVPRRQYRRKEGVQGSREHIAQHSPGQAAAKVPPRHTL